MEILTEFRLAIMVALLGFCVGMLVCMIQNHD